MPRKKRTQLKKARVTKRAAKASRGFSSPLGNLLKSAVSTAREHKLISGGLAAVASNTSGPFSLAANIGSKIASSLGFDTPVSGAGGTAQSAPAPVAFPRIMDYKPSMSQFSTNGHTIVHSMEMVASSLTSLPGTAGFYIAGSPEFAQQGGLPQGPVQIALRPSALLSAPNNSAIIWENTLDGPWPSFDQDQLVFPLAGSVAQNYMQYKLKGLRIHYEHFCPTSVTGAAYLYFTPNMFTGTNPTFINEWLTTNDPVNYQDLGALTESEVANSQYVAQGAVYEDFFLDVPLSDFLDGNKWYYNAPTAGHDSVIAFGGANAFSMLGDPNNCVVGSIGVFFANILDEAGVPGTAGSSYGKLWIEACWELTSLQSGTQTLTGPHITEFDSAFAQSLFLWRHGLLKELPKPDRLHKAIDRWYQYITTAHPRKKVKKDPPVEDVVVVSPYSTHSSSSGVLGPTQLAAIRAALSGKGASSA